MTLRHNENSINYNPVNEFFILMNLSFSEKPKVSVFFFFSVLSPKNCMIMRDFTN